MKDNDNNKTSKKRKIKLTIEMELHIVIIALCIAYLNQQWGYVKDTRELLHYNYVHMCDKDNGIISNYLDTNETICSNCNSELTTNIYIDLNEYKCEDCNIDYNYNTSESRYNYCYNCGNKITVDIGSCVSTLDKFGIESFKGIADTRHEVATQAVLMMLNICFMIVMISRLLCCILNIVELDIKGGDIE